MEEVTPMVKWSVVFVGFVLSLIFSAIFGMLSPTWGSNLGLFIAGLIVGLMVEGFWDGLANAAVAGAFGAIVIAILILIGGSIFYGLAGFVAGAVTGITLVVVALIQSLVVMGLGGAIGGLLRGKS
jgi:hypothetical protein